MRIIFKKDVLEALKKIAVLQISIEHCDPRDPEFLQKASEYLADLAYTVAGLGGLNQVRQIVDTWEGRHA